jgi:hypothetical protein
MKNLHEIAGCFRTRTGPQLVPSVRQPPGFYDLDARIGPPPTSEETTIRDSVQPIRPRAGPR